MEAVLAGLDWREQVQTYLNHVWCDNFSRDVTHGLELEGAKLEYNRLTDSYELVEPFPPEPDHWVDAARRAIDNSRTGVEHGLMCFLHNPQVEQLNITFPQQQRVLLLLKRGKKLVTSSFHWTPPTTH